MLNCRNTKCLKITTAGFHQLACPGRLERVTAGNYNLTCVERVTASAVFAGCRLSADTESTVQLTRPTNAGFAL